MRTLYVRMSETKPLKRRASKIDWVAVRREYETTDISRRQLARRWGMASDNSIRRRAAEENWVKDTEAITAGLVTAAVAKDLSKRTAHKPAQTQDDSQHGAISQDGAQDVDAERVEPPLRTPNVRAIQTEERDRADAQGVETARDLASIHATAIREQVILADKVVEVGERLLDVIRAALDDDPARRMKSQNTLQINSRTDGLAASIDAAVKLLDKGVGIKRRALGMDVVKNAMEFGSPVGSRALGERKEQDVRDILKKFDLEQLIALSDAAEEVEKLRPAVIDFLPPSLA